MESLLVLILFGIISAFINREKKKHTKPMARKENSPKTVGKTLDDFTKEIMNDLSEKANAMFERPKVEEKEIETISSENEKTEPLHNQHERIQQPNQVEQSTLAFKRTKQNNKQPKRPFTTSKDMLVNAMIAQEILGPPKSKQR